MHIHNRLRAAFLCLLLSACSGTITSSTAQPAAPPQSVGMLWNPGPDWSAAIPQDGSDFGACDVPQLVSMNDAGMVGNPAVAAPIYCTGPEPVNPGGAAPSYFHNTYGWPSAQFAQSPGWNVENLSGGDGTPITFRLSNFAHALPVDCALREVSVSYVGWRDLSQYPGWSNLIAQRNATVFKDLFDISKFSAITGTFEAKLDQAPAASTCTAFPTNNVDNDFAVQYFDARGTLLRTDILGNAIYDGESKHSENPEIFFSNGCVQSSPLCQIILDSQAIGIPALTTEFQTYRIEYLGLLKKYLPPPPADTSSSLVIVWEVYSSSRGGDVQFDVTNMNLTGTPH